MSQPADSPVSRSAILGLAVAAGLLALAVGLAVRSFLSLDLMGLVIWLIMVGLLVVIIVRVTAAHPARPIPVRLVTAATTLVAAVGIVAAIAVPLGLRQAEFEGNGVIWRAGAKTTSDPLRPYAVIGQTAILKSRTRIVFLALADGALVATLPAGSGDPVVAGDRLLVDTAEGFQLYDSSARPLWPKAIYAEAPVAAAGDITVLQQRCDRDTCVAAFDLAGKEVWQDRITPSATSSQRIRLPDRIPVFDRGDQFALLDAADGRRRGTVRGDWVVATGPDLTLLIAHGETRCKARREDRPFGEAFDCAGSLSFGWRDDQLMIIEGSDEREVTLVRLDGPGGQIEEVDRDAAFGYAADTGYNHLGRAQLRGRVLSFADWPVEYSAANRQTDPLPIDLNADGTAAIIVKGDTVLVRGPAEPRLGGGRDEDQWIVFDFATGAETGRLPDSTASVGREEVLSTGPGQVLICPPEQPPMLIGRAA